MKKLWFIPAIISTAIALLLTISSIGYQRADRTGCDVLDNPLAGATHCQGYGPTMVRGWPLVITRTHYGQDTQLQMYPLPPNLPADPAIEVSVAGAVLDFVIYLLLALATTAGLRRFKSAKK